MYLQVVHYYDQKAETPAAIIHASVQEETTENPVRKRPVKNKTKQNSGSKSCNFSSLICYTDQNQMRVPYSP